MSEKRFTVDDDGIYDNQEKKHFKFIAYDWMECDIYECCEKLNEQQATITHLEKVFGKNFAKRRLLEQDNLVLRNENEQLRQELEQKKVK